MRILIRPPEACVSCHSPAVRTSRSGGRVTKHGLSWLFYFYRCDACGTQFACVSNDRWRWAPRLLTAWMLGLLVMLAVASATWLSFGFFQRL